MTAVMIFVPEISRDTCKNAIEGALRPLTGVREASVDIGTRQVRVNIDESAITRDALTAAIEEQGYQVPASG